jgi:predicted membrane protein
MSNYNKNNNEIESPNGKRFAGLTIIAVGVILMMKKLGYYVPNWIISWPMLLIVIGLYNGFKHNFRNHTWWILSLIGGLFLADKFIENVTFGQFVWPTAFIVIGLYLVFGKHKPKKKWNTYQNNDYLDSLNSNISSSEDYLDTVAIFGGIQKKIVSKNFKGADVVCIFSGAEINLSMADINGTVVMELVNILGGTSLIIPPHWEVRSEIVSVFGGVEDKRNLTENSNIENKVLILRGTAVFGGIDIKSY